MDPGFFHLTVGNILVIIGFFASGGTAVWAVSWNLSNELKKLQEKQEQRIMKLEQDEEIKRARIYARIDEVKTHTENTFVRKDICAVLHNNTEKIVENLERRMEEWVKEIKAMISKKEVSNG